MKKYLVKLVDGGIINIKDDSWEEYEGCETCGYGALSIGNMLISFTKFDLMINIEAESLYDIPTQEDVIHLFTAEDKNINEMTEDEFADYIKNSKAFKPSVIDGKTVEFKRIDK